MHYEIEKRCPCCTEPTRTKAKTIGEATEHASGFALGQVGNSATVRRDGKIIIRYWRDSIGLQYIRY